MASENTGRSAGNAFCFHHFTSRAFSILHCPSSVCMFPSSLLCYPLLTSSMASASGLLHRCTKVVAVAKNYGKHIAEMKKLEPAATAAAAAASTSEKPAIFLKPLSSIIYEGQAIVRPKAVSDLHHEVELGLIISKKAKGIKAAEWQSYVGGYVLGLDMTARCQQTKAKAAGLPWTLGKCWDTFTALSKELPVESLSNPMAVQLWLNVNGKERQNGSTADMIHSIPSLVEYISTVMTLEPGDVVLTGTPDGIGPVLPGDVITAGLLDGPGGKSLVEVKFPVVQGDI